MLQRSLSQRFRCSRFFSTSSFLSQQSALQSQEQEKTPLKADVRLVKLLRSQYEGMSLNVIKKALEQASNNVQYASILIQEYQQNASVSQKKQERPLRDGLVSIVSRRGIGTSFMRLECETDFVARTSLFKSLSVRLASTALFYKSENTSEADLLHAPLLDHIDDQTLIEKEPLMQISHNSTLTVESAIKDAIIKLGENIQMRLLRVLPSPPAVTSSDTWQYVGQGVHGAMCSDKALPSSSNLMVMVGRSGVVVVLQGQGVKPAEQVLEQFLQKLAQHIIGMQPESIQNNAEGSLIKQVFLFNQDKTVEVAIKDELESKDTLNVRVVRFVAAFSDGSVLQDSIDKQS